MANIKTTDAEWVKCREYFEAGVSLSKITAKTGISKTQISKRSNAEGWAKGTPEKKQLIADAVRVEVAKGTLTEQALEVHKEIVDEQTKYINFFNQAALRNTKQAMDAPCEGQNDYRARADTIAKGREVVLGKTPDTLINNTNAQQNDTKITYEVIR